MSYTISVKELFLYLVTGSTVDSNRYLLAVRVWGKRVLTRQAVYLLRIIEARLCNHCCSGKSSKYCVFCVSVCSLRYPACNAHAP